MSTARTIGRTILGPIGLAWILISAQAAAAPLDLANPTPRWVEVRFEVSPHDAPGQLDAAWSAPRRAFLEPLVERHRIRIRIPGEELESQLRSTGSDPIGGTFTEFVWTLDAETGHVIQAEMTGRLRESYGLGIFRSSAEVEIRVEMTTRKSAGFRPPHQILGQRTHAYCRAVDADKDCTLVPPMRFDPSRGYVNAVGSLRATTPLVQIRAFSPLGEVVFSEIESNSAESMVSGRSSHDAVCSRPMIEGSCRPDLRGESS